MVTTAFLSRSPGLLNRGPGGPASLGHGPHSSIFSPTDLRLWTPTAQSGVLRAPSAGCWFSLYSILSPTDRTSCRWGYIIIWHPHFFLRASRFRTQFNPSTVKVISWYSSIGCTCYLHRFISFFDSLAGSEVNIQQKQSILHFMPFYLRSHLCRGIILGRKNLKLDKTNNFLGFLLK